MLVVEAVVTKIKAGLFLLVVLEAVERVVHLLPMQLLELQTLVVAVAAVVGQTI